MRRNSYGAPNSIQAVPTGGLFFFADIRFLWQLGSRITQRIPASLAFDEFSDVPERSRSFRFPNKLSPLRRRASAGPYFFAKPADPETSERKERIYS